jgi:sugar phosphate isomerase/epimerase
MNRRKFISATSAASTLLVSNSNASNMNIPKIPKANLKILATNWGWEGSIDQLCEKVKNDGYNGLELWWPTEVKERKDMFDALQKYKLEIGFLCGGSSKNPVEHLAAFKKVINEATSSIAVQKPLYINCHSGRDFFNYEQNKAFIDFTTEASQKSGINIMHETHRGRMLFAAHIAQNFIEKNPKLRLTLDISHWCNVHESLLEDQAETVDIALSRTDHIHARIGHQEGPQVNDPRAPEWQTALNVHLAWWDKVIERKAKEGKTMTILTEFGPPNYMPTTAYTQQPLANQWQINVHMMNLLRKRWES